MAAPPKLSPDQWSEVRARWEHDPRDGYTWLVAEMALPVSAPAVRKVAVRDGWLKKATLRFPGEKPTPETIETKATTGKTAKPKAKKSGAKVSKVSQSRETKAGETIETLGDEALTLAERVERDPDQFGEFAELSDSEEMFVREYMVDWNGTKAAIRSGYSAKSAAQAAWALLRKPKIREAIETLASARARRLGIDADELIRMWAAILTLDANELTEHRRVCCPYCWGEDHQRQYTPASLEEARKKHERERQRRMKADNNDDIGEFPEYADDWYDKRREINPECPECHGEGYPEVFIHDTRRLSPAARLVYSGVKEGRDGIEILTLSKEKAADSLARVLGLFKDKEAEVNINMVSGDDLFRLYEEKMQQSRARQAAVLSERGMIEAEAPGSDVYQQGQEATGDDGREGEFG